jgi:peptide/nickel transport system permease protein
LVERSSQRCFFLALAGAFVPAFDATRLDFAALRQPPTAEHLLGTDGLGRDNLSRLVVGASITLRTSLAATIVAFATGLPLGWLAGRFSRRLGTLIAVIAYVFLIAPVQLLARSWSSRILMAVCSGALILPGGLLAFAALTLVQPGPFGIPIALGLFFAPAVAFVSYRVLQANARHAWFALMLLATSLLAWTALAGSALGMMELGVAPPMPSWGSMLGEFRAGEPWLSTLSPAACLLLTCLGAFLFGDGLAGPRLSDEPSAPVF